VRALVFTAIILSSASAYADDTLTVKITPPKKGEVADVVNHVDEDMRDTGGQQSGMTIAVDDSWTQEVLAVDKDIVTKERVSFAAAHQKIGGTVPVDKDLEVAKKTYVATAAGGKVSVTDAKGGTVPADESLLVAMTLDNIGKADKTAAMLGDTAFTKGVAVPLKGAALASLMGADGQIPISGVTVTLVDNDGKRARFDFAGKIDGDKQEMHIAATFTGSVTIDLARGRMIVFDMSSDNKMTTASGKHDAEMKLVAHRTITYR
jgi:hypothetical protein